MAVLTASAFRHQRTVPIAEQIAALEEEMKIAALPPEPEILRA